MISVRRLAPMRSERLCTSSGSTVRISSRKGSEVTSLLYLEASGAWRACGQGAEKQTWKS